MVWVLWSHFMSGSLCFPVSGSIKPLQTYLKKNKEGQSGIFRVEGESGSVWSHTQSQAMIHHLWAKGNLVSRVLDINPRHQPAGVGRVQAERKETERWGPKCTWGQQGRLWKPLGLANASGVLILLSEHLSTCFNFCFVTCLSPLKAALFWDKNYFLCNSV